MGESWFRNQGFVSRSGSAYILVTGGWTDEGAESVINTVRDRRQSKGEATGHHTSSCLLTDRTSTLESH
eukprot:2044762-Amphidinium_carterae.1